MVGMLYELNDLKKTFGRRTVLDLAELSLKQGGLIGLLGPNGAGKTTLLEILGFLRRPTSGNITFRNTPIDFTERVLMQLRRRVVLVQQHPILFTTTVHRNLEFPLKIRGMQREERERTIEELLELVGMREFRYARAHKLSGGETQRIAIARALACFPQVVLFDEPTASVDVENQIAIERIIREINREKGLSVVFTTHDLIQASRLADTTIFLFQGRLAHSTYENIFSGRIELADNGRTYCVMQNRLKLAVETDKTGAVRISVDPAKVKIHYPPLAPPGENSFTGNLNQLTDEHLRVRALVDVGLPLSVLIPKEEFKTIPLELGGQVQLTCPPESIEII
jgi:tungstate transport system ATP-binding protein